MITKILPVILILSKFFAINSGEDPCAPQCVIPNSKTADPRDCFQYYYCYSDLTHSNTPFRCPTGTRFDIDDCTGLPPCHPICPECHLTCDPNIEFDTVADVKDCSVSYTCEPGGIGTTLTCPENKQYYDSITKVCTDDPTVCCNPGCVPHCYGDRIRTADPTNCKKYYTCLDGAVNLLLDCPAGETFDLPTGLCKTGVKCNEWCTSEVVTSNPNGCLTSLQCTEEGFFPKCPDACDARYFDCAAPGIPGVDAQCPDGLVFNPVPGFPSCLQEAECPFPPQE